MPLGDLDKDDIAAFFSIGFTHHREIIRFCKDFDERLYYVRECAKGMWSVEQLLQHLRADDYHHIGALPNNFEKTLSPVIEGVRRVMANARAKSDLKPKKKSAPRKTSKGGRR